MLFEQKQNEILQPQKLDINKIREILLRLEEFIDCSPNVNEVIDQLIYFQKMYPQLSEIQVEISNIRSNGAKTKQKNEKEKDSFDFYKFIEVFWKHKVDFFLFEDLLLELVQDYFQKTQVDEFQNFDTDIDYNELFKNAENDETNILDSDNNTETYLDQNLNENDDFYESDTKIDKTNDLFSEENDENFEKMNFSNEELWEILRRSKKLYDFILGYFQRSDFHLIMLPSGAIICLIFEPLLANAS